MLNLVKTTVLGSFFSPSHYGAGGQRDTQEARWKSNNTHKVSSLQTNLVNISLAAAEVFARRSPFQQELNLR